MKASTVAHKGLAQKRARRTYQKALAEQPDEGSDEDNLDDDDAEEDVQEEVEEEMCAGEVQGATRAKLAESE